MKSKRCAIFSLGWDGILFDSEALICPNKEDLIISAFRGFFLKRIAERGENYCIVISPLNLEENPLNLAQNPFKIRYWATTGIEPRLHKARVLGKLFPEHREDPEEIFNLNLVEFEKIEIVKRIELNNPTTAWSF